MNDAEAFSVYSAWLDVFNRHDWERFEASLAADAMFTFAHLLPSAAARLDGRSEIVGSFERWQSTFSALSGHITDSISEGDRTAVELWWSGSTLTGRAMGFAACHWVQTANHQIVSMTDYFDQKTYQEQVDD